MTFSNDAEAKAFGIAMWHAFGGSTTRGTVRPFGNVVVDGFDFGELTEPLLSSLNTFTFSGL